MEGKIATKNMKRNIAFWRTILVLFILLAVFGLMLSLGNLPWFQNDVHVSYLETLFTGFSLVGAAVSLFLQMRESHKLQEAEFILNLNQSFVETGDYAVVYTALEKEYFTSPEYRELHPDDDANPYAGDTEELKLSRFQISNYLTFFECIYLLLEKGAIQMEMLNDLFSYRFFLAAHSELFQREKLVLQPGNFKNIYWLERRWMDYRLARGLHVYRYANRLEAACERCGKKAEYDAIMEGYTVAKEKKQTGKKAGK
ncbi:MAG: hypothetical protein K6E92_04705 [Lachnospiraceae bacterium]|nr:hypothetical protein [Lachnospiraceae bacterium]